MMWSVYADLARPLTSDEQPRASDALDALVPDGGCMGPNRSGDYEIYFEVTGSSLAEAETTAARLVNAILERAGVTVAFSITLQPDVRQG
jgi:hypothetical protein